MIKIDKDMKIPTYSGAPTKYPWRDMEVGDSFFAPVPGRALPVPGSQRELKHKFTRRTVTENGVEGTRIWRIK